MAKKETTPVIPTGHILRRDIAEDMKKSYLDYSMDVIVDRALPDVRDGMKPVHRRIIFDMYEEGVLHTKPYKKSARTVGDVLGKYHPHGDSSVYGALVRLAQDFSLRYPLVDGHGNFGSIDGDTAAAMRYTEARLAPIAEDIMEDIEKETVDMMANYDETLKEPKVLPSKIPNFLLNGGSGIAVGMASNVPTHNIVNVVDSIKAMLDKPDITDEEMLKYIVAPDFPTGGIIIGRQGIHDLYTTGRGSIRVRSKYSIEPVGKGDRQQIVITEIPYGVNKEVMVQKIDDLAHGDDKVLSDVGEVRDESNKEGIRVVIVLKKGANVKRILKMIFKKTPAEQNFSGNMNALIPARGSVVPRVLTITEIVGWYIKHRKEVLRRKYEFLLRKDRKRQHRLEGLIKAVNNINDVVAIIKGSKSQPEASERLAKKFGFDEPQCKAILDFRLQGLIGLNRKALEDDLAATLARITRYEKILSDEKEIEKIIRNDCDEMVEKYGDERRTQILAHEPKDDADDVPDIPQEDVIVSLTNTGYIKRMPTNAFRSQGRAGKGVSNSANKDLDIVKKTFFCNTHDTLLCFERDGKVYKLPVSKIPEGARTARGQFLAAILGASGDIEIVSVIACNKDTQEQDVLIFTHLGGVKKIKLSDLQTSRSCVQGIKPKENDFVINAMLTEGTENAVIATAYGRLLAFPHASLMPHGRAASTVRGIRLQEGDYAVSADIFRKDAEIFTVISSGYGRRSPESAYTVHNVGTGGSTNYKLKKGELVASVISVTPDEDLLIATKNGKMLRTPSEQISSVNRTGRGVRVLNLDEGDEIISVTAIPKETEESED